LNVLPPVTSVALAFAAGVALSRLGASLALAPLVGAILLLAPIRLSRSPTRRWLWAAAIIAGLISGSASQKAGECTLPENGSITGRFLAAPRGGSAPFRIEAGCEVRVVLSGDAPGAGILVQVAGTRREGRAGPWFLASSADELAEGSPPWRWAAVRWRGNLVDRLHRLYGARGALAAALILARREGLDPQLREAFAHTGIAHLLA